MTSQQFVKSIYPDAFLKLPKRFEEPFQIFLSPKDKHYFVITWSSKYMAWKYAKESLELQIMEKLND
jgi:hypothetical protein